METATILVIEDEIALQDAIQIQLKKAGILVLAALTGEEGLKILETQRPSLIWLDLLMPGMGGFAFLEHMRADASLKEIPVVIVSLSASQEKIKRAFELNVLDYFIKSQYTLGDLVERVKRYLKK